MTDEAIIKLNESEITCILDAIKYYVQVIADELSDDKYKDTPEYKVKSEYLKVLKELQDKVLYQHDLLASQVLERCDNISGP